MANELVDVRHPEVGISRVPKSALHLWQRSGWEEISAEEAEKERQKAAKADAAAAKKAGTAASSTTSKEG